MTEQWTVDRLHASSTDESATDIAELAQSIKEDGMSRPLAVSPDGLVYDGYRRLRVAQQLGMAKVPIIVCQTFDDVMAEMDLTRIHGVHKVTPSYSRIWRFHSDTQDLRVERGRQFRTAISSGPKSERVQRAKSFAHVVGIRQLVTTALGISANDYQVISRLHGILTDPTSPYRKAAKEFLDDLYAGRMTSGMANKRIRTAILEANRDYVTALTQQREIMNNALNSMRGAAKALEAIKDVNTAFTVEELSEIRDEYAKVKGAIMAFQNRLKETHRGER